MNNPEQRIKQTPEIIDERVDNLLDSSSVSVDPKSGLAIVVIKPEAFKNRDLIIKRLEQQGLHIEKTVERRLPENFVIGTMYKDLPKSIEEETLRHFNMGPSEIILVKGGDDTLKKVVEATGLDTNPDKCDKGTIRYMFGEHFGRDMDDGKIYYRNATHRAKNPKEQKEDLDKFKTML